MLSYIPMSKFSMAKLVGYRKYCSCKLIRVKISLPNIYANVHEQSDLTIVSAQND